MAAAAQRARPPAPVERAPLGWSAGQRQHAASRTTARAREEASQGVERGAQGTPQPRGLLDCCSSGVGRPRCLHLVRCGAAWRAFTTRGVSELSGCSALRRTPHALRHALPVCARRGFLAAERKTKQRSQARGLPAHAIHCRGSDSRAAGATPAAAEQAAGLLRARGLPHGLQARAGAPRALRGQEVVATPDSPPLCCAADTSRAPKCSARCRRAVWTSAGCVLAGKAAPSAGSRRFDSTHPHLTVLAQSTPSARPCPRYALQVRACLYIYTWLATGACGAHCAPSLMPNALHCHRMAKRWRSSPTAPPTHAWSPSSIPIRTTRAARAEESR